MRRPDYLALWIAYALSIGACCENGKASDPVAPHERDGFVLEKHPDGTVSFHGHYRNGKKHGKFFYFRPSGSISEDETYEDGELHGLSRGWYANGQLAHVTEWERGVMRRSRNWYDNGELQSVNEYDQEGKSHGTTTMYWPDGRVSRVETWDHGNLVSVDEQSEWSEP